MRNYESVFIVRPEFEDEKVAEIMEKYKSLIENHGGEIIKIEKWGKRRLAYEIDKVKEGIYIIVHFKAEPELPLELDRVYKISDEVIRHIIVREDE